MPGSAQRFLEYNIVGSMKHLLAFEGHARNLTPSYETEEASCLMKHALSLEEAADEGISHASELGDKAKAETFRRIQRGAQRLRQLLRQKVDPAKLITEARQLRREAEALDPSLDLEKCVACGPMGDQEGLEEIQELASHENPPSPAQLDEIYAHGLVDLIAEREGMKPPELVIDPSCVEPDKAWYEAGKIRVCKGAANLHVIAHEFKHFQQDKAGRPLDEEEAERYAVSMAAHDHKGLNPLKPNNTRSEHRMAIIKKQGLGMLGTVYGASVVGAGVEPLNDYLNTTYPAGVAGQNPSLLMDIAAPILLGWGALEMAAKSKLAKWALPTAVVGGAFIQDLIKREILPRVMPPAAAVRVNTGASVRVAGSAAPRTITAQPRIAVQTTQTHNGKFRVV